MCNKEPTRLANSSPEPSAWPMSSTTELNPNFAVNTRVVSAAIMRIFTTSPNKTLRHIPIAVSARRSRVKHIRGSVQHQRPGVPRPNQTPTCPQYTSRLCHHHNVEEDMNSLGLRHTSPQVIAGAYPIDGDPANPSRVNHAHPPFGIAEASSETGQATCASHQSDPKTKLSRCVP